MNKKLLSLYGLKWNPFSPDLPSEALYIGPRIENFCWRIEQSLVREGGFALITGEPGTGKSVTLRVLAQRLQQVRDVTVGVLTHPQSSLADFYREMGEVFGVAIKPHNRWNGFKTLRERWKGHLGSTLLRPVLLIDEVQEMSPSVLSELRLMGSTDFDSRNILSVVLAGDGQLTPKLRRPELVPLGSRIRMRLTMEYAGREELRECFEHLLESAGNRKLMTEPLIDTLCDHAAGNYRLMTNMAAELLMAAVQQESTQLDEKLYLEVFAAPKTPAKTKRSRAARQR
ncbi:MAG: ATP-binding protein [Acidobacteriota bacterium]|nr:ATP-binding protein [Acidobacteriota bacterium]